MLNKSERKEWKAVGLFRRLPKQFRYKIIKDQTMVVSGGMEKWLDIVNKSYFYSAQLFRFVLFLLLFIRTPSFVASL